MAYEGPLGPVAQTVAELRSSPVNVILLGGIGFLAVAVVGPEKSASFVAAMALGATAMGLYRNTLTPVSHSKPNPIAAEEGSKVQTLIFDKHVFTQGQAVTWAKRHGFTARKVDVKEGTYRIRQRPPKGFARMRTIRLTDGVQAVVGFKS